MERSQDGSSPSLSLSNTGHTTCPCVHWVKCSGDRKENLFICSHHAGPAGPDRGCSDVRKTGDNQGAGPNTNDDVTTSYTDRSSPNVERNCLCTDRLASYTEGSKVNPGHRLEGLCGGGATQGTDHHRGVPAPSIWPSKAFQRNINPVTPASDSVSQERSLTSEPLEVSSDDEAVITELPWGQLSPPTAAPRSRNTFECSRRQSAPGELVQDDGGGSASELQSRRPGIVEYFSSRRQQSFSHSVPGWKLFGKVPPRQSPSKHTRTIQQEFEARSSPTHHAAGQQSRRKVDFEPLSTTALILEHRPANLPAKSAEETQRHRHQYEQIVAGVKRRGLLVLTCCTSHMGGVLMSPLTHSNSHEPVSSSLSELKEAQRRQQQRKEQFRQEEEISNATLVWNQHILPHWDTMRSSARARDLWWGGLPPSVRGRVWCLAISNELNITAELYEIFLSRAKEKWTLSETETHDAASLSDRHSSLDLITRDVSRTFPSLCIFQKDGPYHDLLQSILGAYTCYRPDVGYVQGMSSIAAVLILNMDEVQVFISFSNLINRPCQLAFYRGDQQLMFRYFGAFQVFLEETLPRLFVYFRSLGVTPDLYLMDWILSLYTKPLPLDVVCRVWDVFFRDGEEFLFRTALGILRLYQDVLLHMDLISIAQFLSRLPDEELLSDRLFSCISATPVQSGTRKWSQVLSSCSS